MRYSLSGFISIIFITNAAIAQNTSKRPSDILDLSKWYLTIPFDESGQDGENAGIAAAIYQPKLANYTLDSYFKTSLDTKFVILKAHCGGAHTPNSGFSRTEFREMTGKFDEKQKPIKASWSSTSGRHEMEIKQAILKLPTKRPEIVIGQIHDDKQYTIFFRLKGKKLFVRYNDTPKDIDVVFTENYELGTIFAVKFIVENGKTECYFNGEKKFIYENEFSNAYFKAGAYVQSACWGKSTTKDEDCNDFGEVAIYDLKVKHTPEL